LLVDLVNLSPKCVQAGLDLLGEAQEILGIERGV
jgi:hypothetical protein